MNILYASKRMNATWIGHILYRNCLAKHVGKIEGRIQATGRREGRRQQPLDDLKEAREYWKLKEEALNRALWKIHCGRDYEVVVRQATVC